VSAPADITLGEVGRRVDRLDQEMRAGFAKVAEQLAGLAFVPAGVYAADQSAMAERMRRLEADLRDEEAARRAAEQTASHRAWQARLSLVMALLGLPLSVLGAVVVALVLAPMR
jgi:hypothetical protein